MADKVELSGGSIPACAGKPDRTNHGGADGGVYPRVCGETTFGFPPPVKRYGSIPACAGKPLHHNDPYLYSYVKDLMALCRVSSHAANQSPRKLGIRQSPMATSVHNDGLDLARRVERGMEAAQLLIVVHRALPRAIDRR